MNYVSTRKQAATALLAARVVYENGSGKWAYCDADTSQTATAQLVPRGVTTASVNTADDYASAIAGENPQGVTYTAGAAITEGQMLVCEDAGDGQVIPFAVAAYADGDIIYILGQAHEDAADGALFSGSFRPYLMTVSKPA